MHYYTSIVTRHLAEAPDLYRVRMGDITHQLRCSENTLMRHLRAEGASYKSLLDNEKKRRLVTALESNPELTGCELSEICGLSCSQSMVRTVQRWFGMTLTEYKQLLEASC